MVPAPTEDGGYRYFEVAAAQGALNMRAAPTTTSAILAHLDRGSALANLGCIPADDHAWCDVQPVGGGPRGYVAADFLRPAIGPDGRAVKGPDTSASRAGQGNFDATGTVRCVPEAEAPPDPCDFGVARSGGGDGTIMVTSPSGRTRAIFYALSAPIGADTSQADSGAFGAARGEDTWTISVGNERYEIPDAAILGG